MGTEVKKVTAIVDTSKQTAQATKTTKTKNINIPMTGNKESAKPVDKSCDGEFSASEALKNFGKGLVSPITNMFSSPKNFALGIAMMAGGALLIAATGGAAAPVLAAAGIATGVVQAGKGVYKIATAKDGDDAEKAFYDIGGATTTIGLSVAGAKASLKQANIETEGMSALGATKKCFTMSKECAKDSAGAFTSGSWKTNLVSACKNLSVPKQYKQCAKEIAAEKKYYQQSFEAVRDTLPDELKPQLTGRSKGEGSILQKIINKKGEMQTKISKIQACAEYSDDVKIQKIESYLKEDLFKYVDDLDMDALRANGYNIDNNPTLIKALVEDQLGARLTLEDVSPDAMNKLIDNWTKETENGNVQISEFENYAGANPKYTHSNKPYFTQEQMNKLQMSTENNGTIAYYHSEGKLSGYTCAQLKIKGKNGQVMELQIRGPKMGPAAETEHSIYDLIAGKDLSRGNTRIGNLFAKTRTALSKVKEQTNKFDQLKEYYYYEYINAQRNEFGTTIVKKSFPEGIDPILRPENIYKLCEEINKLPSGLIKDPFVLKPQLGLVSGSEALNQN